MVRKPRPRGKFVIRSPQQLRALRTPTRHRVLGAVLGLGRCSVAEIAKRLDWKAESLYYHVRALVEAGLIRRVEQRPTGHRNETVYEAVASEIVLDQSNRSEEYLRAVRDVYRAALRATERDLESALESERKGKGPRLNTMLQRFTVRLSVADLRQLRAMLAEIGNFIAEHENPAASKEVAVTMVFSKLDPRL